MARLPLELAHLVLLILIVATVYGGGLLSFLKVLREEGREVISIDQTC